MIRLLATIAALACNGCCDCYEPPQWCFSYGLPDEPNGTVWFECSVSEEWKACVGKP